MKIRNKLAHIKGSDLVISTLLLLLIILRLPSIFEPHWYSDEGLFASIGNALNNGALLYRDIWDHRPPGIFLMYSLANFAGDLNLVAIKILNLLFSAGTLVLIYKIAKKLTNQKVAVISSLVATILLGLPILEANIAGCENFFVFFTLLGIYLSFSKLSYHNFLAGIFFAVATLFSISPFFEILALILYLTLKYLKTHEKSKILHKGLFLLGGIALPWLLAIIYFSTKGIFDEFFHAIFTYNLDVVKSIVSTSLGFLILPNSLLARTLITGIIIYITGSLYLKNKIKPFRLFLSLWATLCVFSILFFQQPYPHFLIQGIPVFSILLGDLVNNFKKLDLTQKLERLAFSILTAFFILNLFTQGQSFPQTTSMWTYYVNFYKYLTGKIDTISYSQFFGEEVYPSYRLNSLLKQNYAEEKNVYVWTNNPWIYDLANLNSPTKYLLSSQAEGNWGEVKSSLTKNSPDLVIIDNFNSQPSQNLVLFLEENNYEYERDFEEYRIYSYNNQ